MNSSVLGSVPKMPSPEHVHQLDIYLHFWRIFMAIFNHLRECPKIYPIVGGQFPFWSNQLLVKSKLLLIIPQSFLGRHMFYCLILS